MSSEATTEVRVDAPARAQETRVERAQMIKSSAIVGASSLLVLTINLVRTKVVALLLGPAGVGLMATLTAIMDLARNLAELGFGRSGVRQIAECAGTGDQRRGGLIVSVVRRLSFVLGLFGAAVLFLLATPVSQLSFGSTAQAHDVAVISLGVLLGVVANGCLAVMQGHRRIGDLARQGIYSALFGTVTAVAIILPWRGNGLAPALVGMAAANAAVAWWYCRGSLRAAPKLEPGVFSAETKALLRLGVAFLVSSLLVAGAAYVVRVIVLRQDGLDGAGLYQAGWALGSLYVGFILQAMSTDFYPRLVAKCHDNLAVNQLVNEQTQIGMLLAGPGVIATVVLAPVLLGILYSQRFVPGADLLRWICAGMALRVVTWPMGFIIVAKNRQVAFVLVEVIWTAANVGLTWWLVGVLGYVGAGVAFFASYAVHAAIVYPIARQMSGFAWTCEAARATALFAALVAGALAVSMLLPAPVALGLGLPLLAFSTTHSARSLLRDFDSHRIAQHLRSWGAGWRLKRS